MSASKTTGFVHVDVDGLWAVRACYYRSEGNSYLNDPCWMEGVPRLASIFQERRIPASFFLVGRDMELNSKVTIAKELLHRGFELANHSYHHHIGLTRAPIGYIHEEILKTDCLLRSIGADPIGFRSPGYDIDARILRVLRRLGYRYDASMLPTYLSPLLRTADWFLAGKRDPKKRQFGRFVYGRAPRKPYFPLRHAIRKPAPSGENTGLLEIPVGTTPGFRLPLTAASLFPKSQRQVAEIFRTLAGKQRPTMLLLHAIDAVDCRKPIVFDDRGPRLAGFAMSAQKKTKKLRVIIEEFSKAFDVQLTSDYTNKVFEKMPP